MHRLRSLRRCLTGFAVVLLLAFVNLETAAEEIVIADDGREVLLKGDGSWHYVSRDRYATASDGRRIVLKPDGSWQEEHRGAMPINPEAVPRVSGAPGESVLPKRASQQDPLRFLLDSVEILRKKTRTHKSTRVDTRTVFRINLTNSTSGTLTISESEISAMSGKVRMESSSGAEFKLLELSLDQHQLAPAESATVTVIADGSPKWLSIKYLSIALEPGALRNSSALQFRKSMDDVSVRSVEDL